MPTTTNTSFNGVSLKDSEIGLINFKGFINFSIPSNSTTLYTFAIINS